MTEIGLYIMISIIGAIVIGWIIYQLVQQRRTEPDVNFSQQLMNTTNLMWDEIRKFLDYLQMKPASQGKFGENIADILLSNLTGDLIEKQYQPADISGIIDFVVRLPDSDLLLPIDSKFILPKEFENLETIELDKDTIKQLNKKTQDRAKEIKKYIESNETTDFVLMFIPDFVFAVLNRQTLIKLSEMKVVPANSSGLLSTIFMINMQHRFTQLNSSACKFTDVQMKACFNITEAMNKMRKGQKQFRAGVKNFTDAYNILDYVNVMINTLEVEEEEK